MDHPGALERVKEEINREFTDTSKVDIKSLTRMINLTATLEEAMRYEDPTSNLFSRVAEKHNDICGVKIKKTVCHEILCKSEKSFFYNSRPGDALETVHMVIKRSGISHIFSVGPRVCVEQNLAMIEAKFFGISVYLDF